MPLSPFQARLAKLLAQNRSLDSYLAGGAALHLAPRSIRYSNDLDYFNDSIARVARAFADDSKLLALQNYTVTTEIAQPGYIRALVAKDPEDTKVEWAHDTAWRFLPVIADERVGFRMAPVDLAINKVLALVGRDEPRDFLDVLELHRSLVPLGAMIWAACGKDQGYSPSSLLELLKRKGRYRQEDFKVLHLVSPIDLTATKRDWLSAIESAETMISAASSASPPLPIGCLFYSPSSDKFVSPLDPATDAVPHFGAPGGVLPIIVNSQAWQPPLDSG